MEWILSLFYAGLFVFLLYRIKIFRTANGSWYIVPVVFLIKCITGIGYGYYLLKQGGKGDMFWYMYETNYLFDSCRQNPALFFKYLMGVEDAQTIQYTGIITTWNKPDFLVNDARTLLRVNLLLRLMTNGAWQVHTILFCMLSTIGLWQLAKFFSFIFNTGSKVMFLCLALTPAVLLWTSLVIKEALLVFFLGMFLSYLMKLSQRGSFNGILIVAFLFFVLLFTIKTFVIILLLPALLAYYFSLEIVSGKWVMLRWATVYVFFVLVAISAGNISKEVSLPHQLYRQQQSSMKFAIFRGDKSYYRPPIVAPNWISIFKNCPSAIADVFTRPNFIRSNSSMKKAAAAENIVIIAGLILSGIFLFRNNQKIYNAMLLCIIFAFSYYAIIGLTTAVEGALVRYKMPGLLFLVALIAGSCFGKKEVKQSLPHSL